MRYARPLSSRIVSWLPGPPGARIAAWATVPWLNAGANLVLGADGTSAVWDQSTVLVVLNYAALSFAVAITLWGTDHIAKRCATLQAATPGAGARPLFRAMDSTVGPLTISLAAAVVFGASALVRDGWDAAFVRGVTWLVIGIALWTFLWTYVSLQLGLNRLGRQRLVRDAVHVDPGLGLQPLGRLASTGLWLLLVWLVPVLLTALPDVLGAAVGLSVLAAALAAFFFSLSGLHRQMVRVKDDALALARELYAEAYEPVHRARTLESLERQRNLLTAADALEKRASANPRVADRRRHSGARDHDHDQRDRDDDRAPDPRPVRALRSRPRSDRVSGGTRGPRRALCHDRSGNGSRERRTDMRSGSGGAGSIGFAQRSSSAIPGRPITSAARAYSGRTA